MMRRLLFTVLLALLPCSASAAMVCANYLCYESVSSTQTNSVVTIPTAMGASITAPVAIMLKNDGANETYWSINSVATSASSELKSGESFIVDGHVAEAVRTLGVICATGETATVRVWAIQRR